MKRNKIILIILGVILLFGFLNLIYYLSSKPGTEKVFESTKSVTKQDHIKWSSNKKIILTEYSDFQCPACKLWSDFFSELKKLGNKDYKKIEENVTFVYRNFPLQTLHKNALFASYAAEAAGAQNKFFEMHDLLYKNQLKWAETKDPISYFIKLADELKLDTEIFKKDIDSKVVKQKVDGDILSGEQAQVSSTPSFFLNGKYLSNLKTTNNLINILLEEIKK